MSEQTHPGEARLNYDDIANPANSYSVAELEQMEENIRTRSGNYLEDLEILYAAAMWARGTLTPAELDRLDYLDSNSEGLDLADSEEYMTLYSRHHGE